MLVARGVRNKVLYREARPRSKLSFFYRLYSNERPTSNKRPPPAPANQTQISAHPHPTHLSE